jgi:hypothetical protein
MIVNKDNIFCILPVGRYETSKRIDDFMENDFTIFVSAKIIKESIMKENPSYFFARNGRHCGLSAILNDDGNVMIQLNYWFFDSNEEIISKNTTYTLPDDLENEFNEYTIICDDTNSIINLYINDNHVSFIEYKDMKKLPYTDSLIWLGCGNMITEDEYKNIGSFEYKLLFALNKKLKITDVVYAKNNYENKYLETDTFQGLPILSKDMPYKDKYKIFCDFKNSTQYKIWDMTGIGNYFQFYIENNIYF